MKIRFNEDERLVQEIQAGLKAKGGYCPCKVGKLPENKCMCEEFKAQIADKDFEGYCHCMLYYKEKWFYINCAFKKLDNKDKM